MHAERKGRTPVATQACRGYSEERPGFATRRRATRIRRRRVKPRRETEARGRASGSGRAATGFERQRRAQAAGKRLGSVTRGHETPALDRVLPGAVALEQV